MIGRIIVSLIITDVILVAASWYIGQGWFINTQIAFMSSALVMGASMLSYGRMIRSRISAGMIPRDERDVIEKLEDPHDLYSDDEVLEQPLEETDELTLKEAIKAEKNRMKQQKRTPSEVLRDSKAAISIYRVGAYVVLVFGFLYLSRHHVLAITPYMIGLGLPMVAVVAALLSARGDEV